MPSPDTRDAPVIYLLRHGQTVWNRAGRFQGQQDSPLTARGIAQAQAMGALLAEVTAAGPRLKVIASPLGRAWQTAVIVSESLGIDPSDIALEPRIAEIAYGDWETHREVDLAQRFPELWAEREADKWNFAAPRGESYALVAERVSEWLNGLDGDGPVVAVGHGTAGRILRGIYLRATPEEIFAMDEPQNGFFRLAQGVVTRFDVETQGV